jgi:hypothetical protein
MESTQRKKEDKTDTELERKREKQTYTKKLTEDEDEMIQGADKEGRAGRVTEKATQTETNRQAGMRQS